MRLSLSDREQPARPGEGKPAGLATSRGGLEGRSHQTGTADLRLTAGKPVESIGKIPIHDEEYLKGRGLRLLGPDVDRRRRVFPQVALFRRHEVNLILVGAGAQV